MFCDVAAIAGKCHVTAMTESWQPTLANDPEALYKMVYSLRRNKVVITQKVLLHHFFCHDIQLINYFPAYIMILKCISSHTKNDYYVGLLFISLLILFRNKPKSKIFAICKVENSVDVPQPRFPEYKSGTIAGRLYTPKDKVLIDCPKRDISRG
jgi:hypothetical protein